MVTDPIADMLVRLANASRAKKELVSIPHSELKEKILALLTQDGFVGDVVRRGRKNKKRLEATLVYGDAKDKDPAIRGARRISRPGRRLYVKAREVRAPRDGEGVLILSTPAGILTHREARAKNVGGEALFEIW